MRRGTSRGLAKGGLCAGRRGLMSAPWSRRFPPGSYTGRTSSSSLCGESTRSNASCVWRLNRWMVFVLRRPASSMARAYFKADAGTGGGRRSTDRGPERERTGRSRRATFGCSGKGVRAICRRGDHAFGAGRGGDRFHQIRRMWLRSSRRNWPGPGNCHLRKRCGAAGGPAGAAERHGDVRAIWWAPPTRGRARLNALWGRGRAVVSPIAGTTRMCEEPLDLTRVRSRGKA